MKIDKRTEIKYLGLVINSNLSWKGHANNLKRELYGPLRNVCFLREKCPNNVMIQIYHALVASRLAYGLSC